VTPPVTATFTGVSSNAVQRRIATGLWSNQFVRLTNVLGGGIVRGNSPSLFLPSDVKVMDAEVHSTSGQALTPVFYRRDGTQQPDLTGTPVALSDIARIAIRGSNANGDVDASVALTLIRNGVVFPLQLPAVTVPKGAAETRVVQINAGGGDVNLQQHLMDNSLYYSQAIFRTLDAAQIAGLLSGFSMSLNGQTVSVAQAVDPVPIRVVGNYLAFKISSDPVADAEWKDFLDRRGIAIGQARVEFVPLSSGGVFAEAVLGRFNSAEKLDITRFWNWQDSPIPIQPSDIAPITAASRAQSDAAIAPGQLSAPIVSIQQPTALPDPSASFAATIAAIQNGNMFRDMSGMSEVVKLAQQAIQASSAGATAAGAQASSNEQNAVNAAADIFKAQIPGSGGRKSAAEKDTSTQGALINEQDKRKGGTAGGGTTGGGGAKSGSNGSTGSTSGTTGGGTRSAPSTGGGTSLPVSSSSSGNPALDVATFGPEGKPTDEAIRNSLGLDPNSPAPTPAVTKEGVPLQELEVSGLYDAGWKDQAHPDREENEFDADFEREMITTNQWRPGIIDFEKIVGRSIKFFATFGDLLFSLSIQPAGSIKSVSITGCAFNSIEFAFDLAFTFDRDQKQWSTDTDLKNVPPFTTMRFSDLLAAPDNILVPKGSKSVQLSELRKSFAPDARIFIYNVGNGLAEEFIQLAATFFQARVTAFKQPIRVVAEEIGVSSDNFLLKSYHFGFGFIGDAAPTNTVDRLEHLLTRDEAFSAFPRRV
jgi:hypothetical protein